MYPQCRREKSGLLSIIIPNHDGRAHLELLLPSISRQTVKDFEVVLVDNASGDDSVETARSLYPDIKVVELDENHGFAAGCNRGAHAAAGQALFFLNSDTLLDPKCVESCRRAVLENKKVGFFQPRVMRLQDRDRLEGAGDRIGPDGRPAKRAAGKHSSAVTDEMIMSPGGAACVWRRDVFERFGGFEEDFFAYLEDVDLGLRALLSGTEGRLIPDAVVYHRGAGAAADVDSGTGALDRPEAVRWIARNKIWLWARCLPAGVIAACAPWMLAGLARSAVFHTFRSGAGPAFWKGTVEGIAGLPKALKQRRRIQGARTMSSREFMKWMMR